jgi:hypothetical protein
MHEHGSEERQKITGGIGKEAPRNESPVPNKRVAAAELYKEKQDVKSDQGICDQRDSSARGIIITDWEHTLAPFVLVGLRNSPNDCSGFFGLINTRGHIRLGDNPDNSIVVVDYWNTPQFMFRHRIQRLLQIVFGTAGYDLARHHFFCFHGFGISPSSDNLQSQIAIGNEADQFLGLLVLDNGNPTDILALHQIRYL